MNAARLWVLSTKLQRRGASRLAKIVRVVAFLLFNCDLSPHAEIHDDIDLWHRGLGIVVGDDVKIGRNVSIGHQVTIAGKFDGRGILIIEDDVAIGAGSKILGRRGHPITLGRGCRIGAGAVVTIDVPAGATVRGPKATVFERESAR